MQIPDHNHDHADTDNDNNHVNDYYNYNDNDNDKNHVNDNEIINNDINLAHIHKVEDVDRDAKESINHCGNFPPFRPETIPTLKYLS